MSSIQNISLGSYYENYVRSQVSAGRYKNASEVIRAALRYLENEDSKIAALKNAIREGIDSGVENDFDPVEHLKELKANHTSKNA